LYQETSIVQNNIKAFSSISGEHELLEDELISCTLLSCYLLVLLGWELSVENWLHYEFGVFNVSVHANIKTNLCAIYL
jgi:hypothetical protein